MCDRHGWWPLRRFLLPRKYRCIFCRATTRRPRPENGPGRPEWVYGL